ncbi:HNH endonuclease [Mycolicibacterium sp. P9-64]|uniref:HNH endonuclease signature motif containing protein n=1 Tax=Mycolicibacterium sp. P9-64 TaxID=2024612 RepID=UPI0011EF313F|nr:HNH endonuclease signature motif containing protein [Mycolicibacterium sp. P9-64]KAA0084379.1 HNH endonuclease [Mycolicibacterium sp. P9-64]
MDLAAAVAAYTVGVDALLAADVDAASHPELVTAYADIESAARRTPVVGYGILARLEREADPKSLGATSLWKLIVLRCRMSKGEARRRIKGAARLAPRRTIQGESLPPEWEHTAAAIAQGAIGDEHVDVIRKFFKALPASIDPITRGQADETLADVAASLDPNALATAAMHLLALLHPDGDLPAEDAARKVGLNLGKQQPDGTSYLSGWISAKLRALIEPALAKDAQHNSAQHNSAQHNSAQHNSAQHNSAQHNSAQHNSAQHNSAQHNSAPAVPTPPACDDPDQPTLDDGPVYDTPAAPQPDHLPVTQDEPVLDAQWRTRAQRTHATFELALETLLCSQTLGTLNGLPTTVVVTTTLQELERGAGYAVTAGGTRLPMRDLIGMAADAHHYLAVFDGHTSAALYLGRAQRCATGAQKLMLFGRDRGCTNPGCDVPFYGTQAHHAVADWKHDGQTNVDDMALACGPDNRMIETTPWRTRRRSDGRTEWIPPPVLDTGQTRVNDIHHPERLLAPRDDDPF